MTDMGWGSTILESNFNFKGSAAWGKEIRVINIVSFFQFRLLFYITKNYIYSFRCKPRVNKATILGLIGLDVKVMGLIEAKVQNKPK